MTYLIQAFKAAEGDVLLINLPAFLRKGLPALSI